MYDGNEARESSILARYSGDGSSGPGVIMSSGQHVYVFLDTSSRQGGRGYQFLYASGCDVVLEDVVAGNITSPGFGRVTDSNNGNYPNFLSCSWTIRTKDDRPLLLKVWDFELQDGSDYLQVKLFT